MPLWSYICGRRGINRIRVYERRDSKCIYVEWFDSDGRHQKVLRLAEEPVTDRTLAKRVAHRMSAAQERRRNQALAQMVFGHSVSHTLPEVFAELHREKEGGWSRQWATDQKRYRTYWEQKLGDTPLVGMSPRGVAQIVEVDAGENEWSPRTVRGYLRYMKEAMAYAQLQLKWIEERHNLSALRLPSGEGVSRSYSETEVLAILDKLPEVDARAHAIGEILYCTGRRLTATRTLPRTSYAAPLLEYPGSTDKARKSGVVVLTKQACAAIDEAPEHPGFLFPADNRLTPVRVETLGDWLAEAEVLAGVPHVDYRGWHALKRVYATVTEGIVGRDKQAGTTEKVLTGTYRQDWLDEKRAVADALENRRG